MPGIKSPHTDSKCRGCGKKVFYSRVYGLRMYCKICNHHRKLGRDPKLYVQRNEK